MYRLQGSACVAGAGGAAPGTGAGAEALLLPVLELVAPEMQSDSVPQRQEARGKCWAEVIRSLELGRCDAHQWCELAGVVKCSYNSQGVQWCGCMLSDVILGSGCWRAHCTYLAYLDLACTVCAESDRSSYVLF